MDPRTTTLLQRLVLPKQDLTQLSFCRSARPEDVKVWVQELPLIKISHASGLLYKALPEVARVKATPAQRLRLAELLRPAVQHCVQGLSRNFLNKPLMLSEAALKTATVAQALQKHLTNTYLTVVRDTCESDASVTEAVQALQAHAIHRGLTGLGLLLLRGMQLYTPTLSQVWREIHTLYQLAEALDVHRNPVDDPLPDHDQLTTVEAVYTRLLLLAAARPNQLRQDEVRQVYQSLNQLAPLGRLAPYTPGAGDNLFAVMLDSNYAPIYRSHLPREVNGDVRELRTKELSAALRLEGPPKAGSSRNRYGLNAALYEHLLSSWSVQSQRKFERRTAQSELDLVVGLSALHYHVSGVQSFARFLGDEDHIDQDASSIPLFRQRTVALRETTHEGDPWENAFDVGGTRLVGKPGAGASIEDSVRAHKGEESNPAAQVHRVSVVDTSRGGFCLEWQSAVPSQLRAGEVLGIREPGQETWRIASVRWVQQARGVTQTGIQVLADYAKPLAAAIVNKTGEQSEYLRALWLPERPALDTPQTLLVNALSFREGIKVLLFSPEGESSAQLRERLHSTGAISQFNFRELTQPKDKAGEHDLPPLNMG
ncbi:hypothetical protein [Marinimicrobium alkaliphilum]|uniref:hypothetical protein n=1 Tax=Marinimicrobium alkaliphilum TaxID=2202654 RepID=UPI000DB9EB2A|nr:hypothetical protein [Marinimicrobium alkaliphilum]